MLGEAKQIDKVNHETIQRSCCMSWIFVAIHVGTIHTFLYLNIGASQRFSLQCDLPSKVQHLQRELHLEVQNLMMMLCIQGC